MECNNNKSMFDANLWAGNPGQLILADEDIHVWRANLECDSASLHSFETTLAPEEKARPGRFRLPRDRNSFIATRGILRNLLGKYIGCVPSEVVLKYGDRGKPSLDLAQHRTIQFNVSRSHGLALFAFAVERSVGIDVELVRHNFPATEIAARYFSPTEIEELKALPPSHFYEGFFLCWTRKEAYVKARGEGMLIPLDSFRVSLAPGQPERLESIDSSRWSLHSVTPDPKYAGALVAERAGAKVTRIRHWDWNSTETASEIQR
jgi:4'-phosphopantetheinyl transferase